MGKYSEYDPKENVIFSRAATRELSIDSTNEYFDETIALACSLPQKVFLVVCWKDIKLTPEVARQYSARLPELVQHVRGIVRYQAEDPLTRIVVRAETVIHNFQKAQAHIYATREEALAAVRRLERESN